MVQGLATLKQFCHLLYDGSSDAGLIRYSDSDWGENQGD